MSAASLKVGFIYCLLLEESLSDSWDVSEGLFTAAEHPHVIIYDREKSSMNSTEVEVLQQFCLIKNLFLCYLLLEQLITWASELAKNVSKAASRN